MAEERLDVQIKYFHDRLEPILEKILERYNKKNTPKVYNTIIKPCKKMI